MVYNGLVVYRKVNDRAGKFSVPLAITLLPAADILKAREFRRNFYSDRAQSVCIGDSIPVPDFLGMGAEHRR